MLTLSILKKRLVVDQFPESLFFLCFSLVPVNQQTSYVSGFVVVVVLLFYVHGKHLRSCRDGQLT